MGSRLIPAAMSLLTLSASAAVAEDYLCDDKTRLTATFQTPKQGFGLVELVFQGSDKQIVLPQVLSADGGRYAAGVTEFWIKGSQATLRQGGNTTTCKR
jgi:membrane-bound inhibitor of C-type lysozyme